MNLLKALAAVSSMTLLSRILGFLRDTVIARAFGAGTATDAFFVAFQAFPICYAGLFAEGAFAQAFVPILAEYKNRRGDADTRLLVDHVSGLLAVTLFVITLIGVAGAPADCLRQRTGVRRITGEVRADRRPAAHHVSRTFSLSRWCRWRAAS